MSIFSSIGSATDIDTSTKAGQDQAKLQDDLNQFLKLLVTQLQNQDPLDPLDANEFTSQLVEFASVEQQIQQNANLEKMLIVQQNSQAATMVSYLGMIVEAKGEDFQLLNSQSMMTYTLPQDVDEVTITFQTKDGLTLRTFDGKDITAGTHSFSWDGSKTDDSIVDDGAYKVIVSAKDKEGNLIDVGQTSFGYVTSTGISDGNITVSMGDVEVDVTDIVSVERPIVYSGSGTAPDPDADPDAAADPDADPDPDPNA
ncbi:MAG: flagellar hook assembly protein FlgD [Magnetovibrio sp.]|nr:flagellar hook assembly protein FlgD [Magnetovibrio sp.]